jgi:deoxyribodipyrimidine photo-lyase
MLAERLRAVPEGLPIVKPPPRFDWGFEPLRLPPSDAALDALLASLPIDHDVGRVRELRGGTQAALRRLRKFVRQRLRGYEAGRNQPDLDQTSGLSPYLHFGHLGAAEVALAARDSEAPAVDREGFLEELIVRRELAFNFAARNPRHGSIEGAPGWARSTLRDHEGDAREATYSDRELEEARTRDEVWNAAQRQLRREGRIHNYLRMLWGKNLLAWSKDAAQAHRRIAWLNDKHALDGRDAVSATNFLWIFGLHDRPFPERPVFGRVRSMTSASARKKLDLDAYLARFDGSQKI